MPNSKEGTNATEDLKNAAHKVGDKITGRSATDDLKSAATKTGEQIKEKAKAASHAIGEKLQKV